ncbi:alanine racemase [Streptomyces parvulus]|uniref:alanine racemase n=1 Tax=Streptomyces parvulus TaxID=146923 RepID=UPI0036E0BFE6
MPTENTPRPSVFDQHPTWPALLIREEALENNLKQMSAFCADHALELAPHVKTHMSPELWRRQQAHGARTATVATAAQATALFEAGVRSLLVANQVVAPGDIAAIDRLRRAGADVLVLVDSAASVAALEEHVDPAPGPLGVLVELGAPGFRTGCRTLPQLAAVADAVRRSPRLTLRGLSGYEGVLARAATPADRDQLLDDYLRRSERALAHLTDAHQGEEPFVVTFGGSDLYPAVVEALAGRTHRVPTRLLLRSGCYLVHDHGKYARAQETIPSRLAKPHFEPALEVWAPVLSVPEPGLAVVGLGNRHVSYDVDLPVPLAVRRNGRGRPAHGVSVDALYDQHAVLHRTEEADLAVGDLLSVGVSHPCTTFDKWRTATVVDEAYRPVETITTHFG